MSGVLKRETMRWKHRTHSLECKAGLALVACRVELTMPELLKRYEGYANRMTEWKRSLLEGVVEIFCKGPQKSEVADETIEYLYAMIERLTIENDFLEPGFLRIHELYGKR